MDAIEILKKPYARLVTPDIDGSFFAEIVEFPGCFATGKTASEALENLKSIAVDWINATLKQGQDIPEPKGIEMITNDMGPYPFKIGDAVEKYIGDAQYQGTIVSIYRTTKNKTRYVIEVLPQGFQMIVSDKQIKLADLKMG